MRLKHLGTAAAERIPAIFCKCEICENAKAVGGKELRTQTQALINDDLLIDFGADSYLHYLRDEIPYADIGDLLVTHWHSDHFYGEDLAFRMHGYGNNFEKLMTVYGSETVSEFYQRAFELEERRDGSRLKYQVVKAGDRFQTNDGKYTVYAFDAKHGHNRGDCVIYGISDGKSAAPYMHDTGFPSQETWQQIVDAGLKCGYVTMDCTSGTLEEASDVHMNMDENAEVRARLLDLGLADQSTVFVANHFSHNAKATHQELVQAGEKRGITVAFDGMETEF